jgi:CheY-like chemotaxis protein
VKILILEDDDQRLIWLLSRLVSHKVFVCKTADEAIRTLKSENFDIIMLDHDLCNDHYSMYFGMMDEAEYEKYCKEVMDKTSGMAVAKYLSQNPERSAAAQIIIHTMNTVAQKRMVQELQARNAKVFPFNVMQKKGLVNVD